MPISAFVHVGHRAFSQISSCPHMAQTKKSRSTLSRGPFCEGPPVPLVQNGIGGGAAALEEEYGDEGLYAHAIVFCHECGAECSTDATIIYTRDEYYELEARAVALWQQRDNRNRPLFNGGEAEGLNLYPRPDEP